MMCTSKSNKVGTKLSTKAKLVYCRIQYLFFCPVYLMELYSSSLNSANTYCRTFATNVLSTVLWEYDGK